MSLFLGTKSFSQRCIRLFVVLASAFLLFQFISLYLSWPKQLVVGGVSVALAMVLSRTAKSHVVTLSLMLISLAATLRYGWWRVHMIVQFFADESNDRFTFDSVLMLILLSAEAYTILIMLLGFMQTSSPLRRKPIPLPLDEALWPHIDVLIPTYNEPLSLVRFTALAANNIDYPPQKLHVYILDDGTREPFRKFAEEAGIGYVVRPQHDHAKAGNINHALTTMASPLVAIFDCDHVPTRSFLQVTVGWFLADQKLAMLQTPHFFYSPDPFERNLLQYKSIPNEGELFYGVIQDGNDLWNATFFCGSCAVIRREALDTVGGIAVETVTEDAHTSLRMQKKGWNTAYINLPQAAGLATETLSAHVGQRVRWARGMIQIFRTDNPLLASGMKLTQRLCYFNAMLHFLYAVPRLIFLCAPLVYMLGGRSIIPGYWVAILAYAMPHLILSNLTNSRVQGKHRHSFWNEIYETVLAPYILMPTLLALINPKLGKFNVTDKGSTLRETTFDRHIAAPTTALLAINLVGVLVAPYRLLVTDTSHPGTVISNLLWILFNMVILGVAAAVANEQQQRRASVRIAVQLPLTLHLSDAVEVSGITEDMSVGGTLLSCASTAQFKRGDAIRVSFPMQTGEAQIGATVAGIHGNKLRLAFHATTITEQETLTCALYSRANSWLVPRGNIEVDRPLVSLGRVIVLSFTGFQQVLRALLPRRKAAISIVIMALSAICAGRLSAQSNGIQIPGVHRPQAGSPTPPNAQPESTYPAIRQPAVAAGYNAPASPITLYAPETPRVTPETANARITFKDMGVQSAINFNGPHSFHSLGFNLGYGRIPRRATLNLTYRFNSELSPNTGVIKVSLNQVRIADIAASQQAQKGGEYAFVALPLPADLLVRSNDLTFEFTGEAILPAGPVAMPTALANVGATSMILVEGDRISMKDDLGLLPLPFFDSELQSTTTIPFVFLASPTPQALQAAAVVASWFGILARSKPVRFTVSVGEIPPGCVIIFANNSGFLPPSLRVAGGGPTLSIGANPSDPNGAALILSGDNDAQVLHVAQALSLMTAASSQGQLVTTLGNSVSIGDFPLPAQRKPDDAPHWLTTGLPISLWSLSSREALVADGSKTLPIYFRAPPDLFYGEAQTINLDITYRYNALAVAKGSALRIFLNGSLIQEIPLPPGSDFSDRRRSVIVPVDKMRPFSNTLLFNFDFVAANPNPDANTSAAGKLTGAILRNSYLDIRGLNHYVAMPDLELFANAGFPFTLHADLSDTTIIVPTVPSPSEIALLLTLMGHWGAQTGFPVLRVQIAGPEADLHADRDLLILGNVTDQPSFASLDDALPVTVELNGIHVKQPSGIQPTLRAWWRKISGDPVQDAQPSNEAGAPDVLLEGIQSPFSRERSIVIVALRTDDAVEEFTDAFLDRSQSSDIARSVSLLRDGKFSSYDVDTPTYRLGNISAYGLMRIWLAKYFLMLLLVVSLLSLVLAVYVRDYLALLTTARLTVEPGILLDP